jgi:hypothetical protein
MQIVPILGILWFIAFPYICQEVFTSENALSGVALSTQMGSASNTVPTFKRIREEVDALPDFKEDGGKAIQAYVQQYLAEKFETHSQPLPKTFGHKSWKRNVYAYTRSQDGYGHECNVLATPINQKPSVVYILTFIDMMS